LEKDTPYAILVLVITEVKKVVFMPVSAVKAGARSLLLDNAPKIFLVTIVYLIITTVMTELEYRLPGFANAFNQYLDRLYTGTLPTPADFYSHLRASGLLLTTVLLLLHPVINVGFMRYCLNISRGLGGDYKNILDGFMFFAKIILINIISAVFIFLWSLLFIFPGIVASYKYRQAYYILLDAPEKSALQCIRESKQLMAGNKLDLFLLDLSFIGWVILDNIVVMLLPVAFTIPLISIWLMPYLGLTRTIYYDFIIKKAAM